MVVTWTPANDNYKIPPNLASFKTKPISVWTFNDCKYTNTEGKYPFLGSPAHCQKGGGTGNSNVLKSDGSNALIMAKGFNKVFSKGLTISARVKQSKAGGVWGLGTTAGHHHFYIRSNWCVCMVMMVWVCGDGGVGVW